MGFFCSCYGAVQSLSGDAERDVAVEAVGQDECSLYSEDTVTDEDGRFRLRGLLVSVYCLRINAEINVCNKEMLSGNSVKASLALTDCASLSRFRSNTTLRNSSHFCK